MQDMPGDAERLFTEGNDLADAGDDAAALRRFREAWSMLPEPREEQELTIHILAAIADCHFLLREWDDCREAIQHALRCGADPGDPFLRLRLGQSLFELGDESEAANWLAPAYLSEGSELFEQDDPKYLEFIRGKLKPPPGGWPPGW